MTSRSVPFSHPTARLEAVRGLAAIAVALFHSVLIVENTPGNGIGVGQAISILNGPAAVTLFFVLSGFVLGLSLRRASGSFREIYLRFAVRRVFRIYPAVIVSTAVAVMIILLCRTFPPTLSTYMRTFPQQHITLVSIVKQLFLIDFLNPVTWTLRMEMVCSLMLPLAFWLEMKWPVALWAALAFFIGLAQCFPTVISIVVMPAFLVGYLLPLTTPWWSSVMASRWQGAVLFVLGLVLLVSARALGWNLASSTLLESIGSAFIVGSVVFGAHLHLFSFFDWHPIKVAGRVSYSYYVYHFPILMLTMAIVLPRLPTTLVLTQPLVTAFILWVTSSLVAFPVAMLSYAAVEKPFIKIGTALVNRGRAVAD